MAKDEDKPESFLGGILKDRIDGLKSTAKQTLDNATKTFDAGAKTVDGLVRDKNTSYLTTDADASGYIYQVMTKGKGKNARVTLWPDRLEWEKDRGISAAKVLGSSVLALYTLGLSLAFTNVKGKKDAFDALPLDAIVGVSIRNGDGAQIVSVATAAGDIDFAVSRQNASEFRVAILNQMQVLKSAPQRVVVENQNPVTVEPAVDYADQLKKLADLRDAGILTEEEFQAKKTEILGKI